MHKYQFFIDQNTIFWNTSQNLVSTGSFGNGVHFCGLQPTNNVPGVRMTDVVTKLLQSSCNAQVRKLAFSAFGKLPCFDVTGWFTMTISICFILVDCLSALTHIWCVHMYNISPGKMTGWIRATCSNPTVGGLSGKGEDHWLYWCQVPEGECQWIAQYNKESRTIRQFLDKWKNLQGCENHCCTHILACNWHLWWYYPIPSYMPMNALMV